MWVTPWILTSADVSCRRNKHGGRCWNTWSSATVQSAAPLSARPHRNSSLFISCHFLNSICCVLHTGPSPSGGREGGGSVKLQQGHTGETFKSSFTPHESTVWREICDTNLKVSQLLPTLKHNPARSGRFQHFVLLRWNKYGIRDFWIKQLTHGEEEVNVDWN